jgi:hypothetical protein
MPSLPVDQQLPPAVTQPTPGQSAYASRHGQIYFDGKPITLEELKAKLTAPPATKRDEEKK